MMHKLKSLSFAFTLMFLLFGCGGGGGGNEEGGGIDRIVENDQIEYIYFNLKAGTGADEENNSITNVSNIFTTLDKIYIGAYLNYLYGGIPGIKIECQRSDGLLIKPDASAPIIDDNYEIEDGYLKYFIVNLAAGNWTIRVYEIDTYANKTTKLGEINITVNLPENAFILKDDDRLVFGETVAKDCNTCPGYHIVNQKQIFEVGEQIYSLTNIYNVCQQWTRLSADLELNGAVIASSNAVDANRAIELPEGGVFEKYSHYAIFTAPSPGEYTIASYAQSSPTGERELLTRKSITIVSNDTVSYENDSLIFGTSLSYRGSVIKNGINVDIYDLGGQNTTFVRGSEIMTLSHSYDIMAPYWSQMHRYIDSDTGEVIFSDDQDTPYLNLINFPDLYFWTSINAALTNGRHHIKVQELLRISSGGEYKIVREGVFTIED